MILSRISLFTKYQEIQIGRYYYKYILIRFKTGYKAMVVGKARLRFERR